MDEESARAVQKILFADGWSRLPVASATVLLMVIAAEQPITRDELHRSLLEAREANGLDGAAWEEPHIYTDNEIAELDEEFRGTPFENRGDEPRTASEATANEQALHEKHVLEMRRYARALGVSEVSTLGDLLSFLVAADVVLQQPTGELTLNLHAPLPVEVLPLDKNEAALQDEMRWGRLHEGIAHDLIGLFRPSEDVRVRTMQAALDDYAAQLGNESESVRAAVEQLISEGDFAADVDVSTVPAGEVFHLSVDWARFARTRISIRRAD